MIVWIVVWDTTGTGAEGVFGGWGVGAGVGDEDVGPGGDTWVPVPTGGVPIPLGGAGVLVSLGGVVVLVPSGGVVPALSVGGVGVAMTDGGVGAVPGGEGWVPGVLLPLLLPSEVPATGVVCGLGAGAVGFWSAGAGAVALEFVSVVGGEVEPTDEGVVVGGGDPAAVDGDVVAVDGGAAATDGEPDVPAGWSARAWATTTSAKTIVARTRLSVVR